MAELDSRRRNLIAGVAVVGALLVVAGYATFDQWASFVGGLLRAALGGV